MADSFAGLADHPHVAEVRQTGMVLAVEMVKDKQTREPYPWQERRGLTVYQHGLKNECLLRPLGNVVYIMPPYVITPEEIQNLPRVAIEGIELATRANVELNFAILLPTDVESVGVRFKFKLTILRGVFDFLLIWPMSLANGIDLRRPLPFG